MIKYLLDTNICIYAIHDRPMHVRERLLKEDPATMALSSVCVAELEYGAAKSRNPDRNSKAVKVFCSNFVMLPFDTSDAEAFGHIRADLERRGCPIGPYDMQIAAQALTRHLVLVTNNVREFERIPHLQIENWAEN